jgi:co-chaperonin GroES (HSP10)
MIKIEPLGTKIIVTPIYEELQQTEGGIFAVELELEKAEVVEVSKELSTTYKVGDVVIYPKGVGESLPHYQKKSCIWLDGRPFPHGNVWAKVTEEK